MLNFVFSQLFVFIALSIFFTLKSYMSQDTGKYLEALLYSVMVVILLAILESLNKTYPGLGAKVVIISPTFFTNVNAEGVPFKIISYFFIWPITSSAKLSWRFWRPSPISKRTKATSSTSPCSLSICSML